MATSFEVPTENCSQGAHSTAYRGPHMLLSTSEGPSAKARSKQAACPNRVAKTNSRKKYLLAGGTKRAARVAAIGSQMRSDRIGIFIQLKFI
jgi:hypothetical protein